MMDDWRATSEALPPEGVEVEVMNGETVTSLVFDSNLWWLPDRSMYVYYTPRLWRLKTLRSANA